MSKLVKLTATNIGPDVTTVDIYHTAVTASNLISSSISASLLTGSGITFTVADNVTEFYASSNAGLCLGQSGSVTASVYSPNTRFLTIETSGSDGEGAVGMTSPFSIDDTTTSFTASVNFTIYSSAVITATAGTYPNDDFIGWFYTPTSSTAFATDTTLTLTKDTFTGSDHIYAYFEDNS